MGCYINANNPNIRFEAVVFCFISGSDYSDCVLTPDFIYAHIINRASRFINDPEVTKGRILRLMYHWSEINDPLVYLSLYRVFIQRKEYYYQIKDYFDELREEGYGPKYKAIKQIVLGFPFGQVFTVKTVYKHMGRFIGWWYAKNFKYDYIRKALDELCEEGKLKANKNREKYTLLRRY